MSVSFIRVRNPVFASRTALKTVCSPKNGHHAFIFFFLVSELPSCSSGLYLFLVGRFGRKRRPESSLRTLVHIESQQRGGTLQGRERIRRQLLKRDSKWKKGQTESRKWQTQIWRHQQRGKVLDSRNHRPLNRGRSRTVILAVATVATVAT